MKRQHSDHPEPRRRTRRNSIESYAERVQRITEREILQSHYAQPHLVESLLLAFESTPAAGATHPLSMETFLNLTQFDKRKKWLCVWGPDLIDETHRPSNIIVPIYMEQKFTEMCVESNFAWHEISYNKTRRFLSDPTHRFDRVTLSAYDPEFFELLRRHPCEELRFKFDFVDLTQEDMENIAQCTSLRIFDFGCNRASLKSLRALRRLPNLEVFIYNEIEDAYSCIRALSQLPQRNTIQINSSNDCEWDSLSFPFATNEIGEARSYIADRKETARHLHVEAMAGPIVLAILSQCSKVESISLQGENMEDESYLCMLFSNPKWKTTLRYLHIHDVELQSSALQVLAELKNLRAIELDGLNISTDDLRPVLIANADSLQSLALWKCAKVGDAVLESIARCKRLRNAYIGESGVTAAAVEAYRAAKRPNWQALVYKAKILNRGSVSDNVASGAADYTVYDSDTE